MSELTCDYPTLGIEAKFGDGAEVFMEKLSLVLF